MSTMTARRVTDKQLAFLTTLAYENVEINCKLNGWTVPAKDEVIPAEDIAVWSQYTTREASDAIDALMRTIRTKRVELRMKGDNPDTASAGVTQDGMYRKNGEIFKVQRAVHGSGNLYAKKLTEVEEGVWKFEYAPGAVRRLRATDRMTLEQAKEWGALYGTCCVCGRTLTNETSIEDGIGPVCGGKL